jgi:hypothetical protein
MAIGLNLGGILVWPVLLCCCLCCWEMSLAAVMVCIVGFMICMAISYTQIKEMQDIIKTYK